MDRRSFLSSAAMAGAYAMTTGFNSSAQQPSSPRRSIRIHTGSDKASFRTSGRSASAPIAPQ
jgi:hypothetical protein